MTDPRNSGGTNVIAGGGEKDRAPEAQRMNPLPRIQVALPKGFRQVIENLSREVLRSQPSDINEFAVEYFGKLLKARDQGVIDMVQATISNAVQLNPYNYTQPAAQHKDAVNVITSQYKNPDEGTFDTQTKSHQAAATLQKAAKNKKADKKSKQQAADNEQQKPSEEQPSAAPPSDTETLFTANATSTLQSDQISDNKTAPTADDTTTAATRTDDETSGGETTT